MVSYSPRAARALALLKRPYNDVDIFVEDTGNHNMWLLLVRQLLPAGTRIVSVNMLGGRDAVEEACKIDQSATGRRKLYITDGDFDWLLGKAKKRLKYLYRLRAYSVENILISEYSLIQIGLEYCPTKTEAQLAADLDFPGLVAEMEQNFRGLFITYAVAHLVARRVQTVGYGVGRLLQNSPHGPRIAGPKILQRAKAVYRQVLSIASSADTRTARNIISAHATTMALQQVVSGKHYALPFVMMRFKAACGYKGSQEHFKVALARAYDPSMEPYLAKRLRRIAA